MYLLPAKMRRLLSESISNSPNSPDSSSSIIKHSAMDPRHSDFSAGKNPARLWWWSPPPTKLTVDDEERVTWTAKIKQRTREPKKLDVDEHFIVIFFLFFSFFNLANSGKKIRGLSGYKRRSIRKCHQFWEKLRRVPLDFNVTLCVCVYYCILLCLWFKNVT